MYLLTAFPGLGVGGAGDLLSLVHQTPKLFPSIVERLSMTFTADGKRQRLPLIFYPFLVILK